MKITVGTFNLNNLFSRYNFSASVNEDPGSVSITEREFTLQLGDDTSISVKRFQGRLVEAKDDVMTERIATRILEMDLDILAVQEVEDIVTLQTFNTASLGGLYPYQVLIEGNDQRLIDLGLFSKYPIGNMTSHRYAEHPDDPGIKVFSRDLLEVDILSMDRKKKLFTVFNNHLKSNFVPFTEDQEKGRQRANERRRKQTEAIKTIVEKQTRPRTKYVVLGDMNDTPESEFMAPLVQSDLGLVNGLSNPMETPTGKNFKTDIIAWTHRYVHSGQTDYNLYDQIWLSPSLSEKQSGAFIKRRTKSITGKSDGSDHDPAWVELNL